MSSQDAEHLGGVGPRAMHDPLVVDADVSRLQRSMLHLITGLQLSAKCMRLGLAGCHCSAGRDSSAAHAAEELSRCCSRRPLLKVRL